MGSQTERIVVVVTGLPASGKTTLSRRLSEALRLPLLSKDLVKESLFDVLGVNDRAWSLQLGAATMEVLWSLLRECPGGAVLDLWLDPGVTSAWHSEAWLVQGSARRARFSANVRPRWRSDGTRPVLATLGTSRRMRRHCSAFATLSR